VHHFNHEARINHVPRAARRTTGIPITAGNTTSAGSGKARPARPGCHAPGAKKWSLRALAVAEERPQGLTGRVGAGLMAGPPPR
jgi:hypothetical protein